MKKDNMVLRFLFDWLLISLGVLGSFYCLISAFDFPVPYGTVLAILTAISFYCGVLSGKKLPRWSAPLLTLGFALFVFLLREEIGESFRNLWGVLCGRYALGYDQFTDLLPRERTSIHETGPALVVLAMSMALLETMSVRWWKRSFPAALALLPGIVPCFILIDTPPATQPLILAAFSILTQIFSQSVRRRETGEHAKAVALSALVSAGILALLLTLFPEKEYRPPITWDKLSKELEHWGAEQGNQGNVRAGLSGNPADVDLSELGALPNRPVTILYAEASTDAFLYLRGSSYSSFDGTHWSRGEARSWDSRIVFPYLGSDGYRLAIESVDPEDLLYTTYLLTALPNSAALSSDAYLRNITEQQSYSMSFRPDSTAVTPDPDYDAWVREQCLALPEQTREGVLAWWEAHGQGVERPWALDSVPVSYPTSPTESIIVHVPGEIREDLSIYFNSSSRLDSIFVPDFSRETVEYARAVAERVSGCARYSRNPLHMPEGVDFCTWFLNDAEEGYCVHYASACTALLRALDIPARYVSGYICPAVANERIPVTNLMAHAWVEIWVGGRWIPIEPTPDNATEFTGQTNPGAGPGNARPEESTETSFIPVTDTLEDMTGRYTEPTRASRPSSEPTEPQTPGGNGGKRQLNLTPLWIFLGIAGLLALALGRRCLCRQLRERKLARAKGNDKARLLYRRILRLSRLSGGTVPEEAEALGKKAAFSQHELEPEELRYLRQVCDHQAGRLGIAGFWKRLWCKYVLCVI